MDVHFPVGVLFLSGKKTNDASSVWTGVRTGAAAAGITLLLLLPVAVLIRRGTISPGDRIACQGIVLFLAGLAASLACRCGRERGIAAPVLAMVIAGAAVSDPLRFHTGRKRAI